MNNEDFSIISDFVSVNADETISKAIEKFKGKIREILVFEEREVLLGYLTQRHLTRQSKIKPDSRVSNFIIRVPTIRRDVSLDEIARSILSAKIRSVPVEENGKVIGVIKDIDLIRSASEIFEDKTVNDVMTRDLISVSSDTTIAKLIAISRTNNISRTPVVDYNNKLLGIVSPYDLTRILLSEFPGQTLGDRQATQLDVLAVNVSEIMSENVITCFKDDSVDEVIQKLYKNNHKAMVVVDTENHPIGIITTRDLLETISRPPTSEGYYIRVIGDVADSDMNQVMEMGADIVKKYAVFIGNSGQFYIHAKAIPKKKFRGFVLYQVRSRIATDKGKVYVSRSEGYGLFGAFAVALDRIERDILSERELEIKQQQPKSKRYILEELEDI